MKNTWKMWIQGWKEEDARQICLSDLRTSITPEPALVAETVLEEWIEDGTVFYDKRGHILVGLIDPAGKKYRVGVDIEWVPITTATSVTEIVPETPGLVR